MGVHEYHQSVNWLGPITALICDREYSEAFALAEFFPPTQSRIALQFVALLGQGNYREADVFLKQLKIDSHTATDDFKTFIRGLDLDLFKIAVEAIKLNYLSLGLFCLELRLPLQPTVTQSIIREMLLLTSRALSSGELNLGYKCLQRLLSLDDSPSRLLQYAEVALISRRRESSEPLFEFAENLIYRVLSQVPGEDLESRLKIARLLAIDAQTFNDARELLRQIVEADPGMISRVFDTISPLIEYKPYFSEIADFLSAIAPEKIELITIRLVNGHKLQRNPALLEKAQSLLDAFDYAGQGYDSQLVKAILTLGPHLDNFETGARRLIKLDVRPETLLEATEILLSHKIKDYALVSHLLERILHLNPDVRLKVLAAYGRLSYLAKSDGQADLSNKFLEKTINLSTGLIEFLERGISNSLTTQLIFINDNEALISKAHWYRPGEIDESIATLIRSAEPYERREVLYTVLTNHTRFQIDRLILCVDTLFHVDLGLTERDVKQIEEIVPSLAPEVQKMIPKRLAKQEIRHFDEGIELYAYHSSSDLFAFDRAYSQGAYIRLTDEALADKYTSLWGEGVGEIARAARPSPKKRKGRRKTPPRRIERHTRVDFPALCKLEKKVDLKIQLTKSTPKKTRVRKKLEFEVAPEVKKITLDINVTAPQFAIQERKKRMLMSVDEDSEEVRFTLVPLELGDQVIEVEFFYESLRVGYLLVKTRVTERLITDSPSNVLVMEAPSSARKKMADSSLSSDRRTVHATWFEKESKLSYTIYSPGINESPEWETLGPNLQGEVESYLQQLNVFLNEIVIHGNPNDEEWNSILLNLQGIGSDLFTKLIPNPLAVQAREWKPGSLVVISTNEQWIPWELMYDENDFWGKRFIIARLPRLSDRRSAPDSGRPEKVPPRSIKRIVNVIGGDVGVAEAKQAYGLFNNLAKSVQVEILQEKSVAELKSALVKTDVLHCTCHGHLEPHMLQVAKDKTILTNLLPQTIHQLPLEPGSFVFANTCTSALPVLTFGRFSSFAWEFYRRGAGAFVGTLGAVPTSHAVCFAESIYREIFGKGSQKTIGQAVALAKNAASSERNLFWLLYCIYGDPDYKLKISAQRRK